MCIRDRTNTGKHLSSNFGEFRTTGYHLGLDIKTKGTVGHPVYAISSGYISRIVTNYSGFGRALYLTLDNDQTAVYAHLSKFIPQLEDRLKLEQEQKQSYISNIFLSPEEFKFEKGDIIGYSGDTGYAFGPNLHFEVRDKSDAALDPLKNGYLAPDKINPIMQKIALIPLSKGALVNSSPLVQTMPLFRDKNGTYLFADTISVIGNFGLAIQAVDKREGSKFKYQFHKAELFIDNKPVFTLNYNRIPYSQTNNVRTLVQYELKKQNLGAVSYTHLTLPTKA